MPESRVGTGWDERLGVWWIAENRPHEPAIVASPGGTMTFGELAGRAHQVVHALRSLGVEDGDTVAVLMRNGPDIVVWSLACQEAGWYFLPLNYNLRPNEVAAIVEHSQARVFVASVATADIARQVTPPASTIRIAVGGDLDGFMPDHEVLAGHPTTLPEDRRPGAVFTYTSGTTGRPKGVRRRRPEGDPRDVAAQSTVFGRAFGWTPFGGPHLVAAAMHHVGTHSFFMGALHVGHGLVIMPRFDPEKALQLISDHRITTGYMVPTMFHRLLQLPDDVRDASDTSSLRSIVHGAAPCPRIVKERMMAWWGPVLWESYGGSEGAATIAKPHRWLEKPGTVGRAIRGVQVTILDDDGNELRRGETGNVYIETEVKPFEYHGDDAQTDDVFKGRSFTIGDIGYLDEDGYLFLRDRAKDVIISGGVNVYPAEIEAVLSGHAAVGDAAVIGVPHPEWGERVKAVVVPVAGGAAGPDLEQELIAYCREHLASFKCPDSVDFRDELPRTDSGKLYKRLIRDEYWAAAAGDI